MTSTLFETVGTGNPAHPTWSSPRDAFWATLGILLRMKGWERRRRREAELHALSNHQLRGIGLGRADVRLHRLLAGPPIMLMQPQYR